MTKVVTFPGAEPLLANDPDVVLESAKGQLEDCMVIGWLPEGRLYVAASTGELGDNLTMLELAKATLISGFVQ